MPHLLPLAAGRRAFVLVVLVALSAFGVLATLAPSSRASEKLYFSFSASGNPTGIGTIGVDGAGLREDLIPSPASPGVRGGIAVTNSHIYYRVAVGVATRVYRVAVDGSATPTLFFTPCEGSSFPNSKDTLATDGQFLYYVCTDTFDSRIGRIGLDGSGRNDAYIDPGPTAGPPVQVWEIAVNRTHIFMMTTTDIIRADLSAPTNIISTSATGGPNGIAVNSTHVLWTVGGGSPKIMRAGLDLTNPTNVITGLASLPVAIAATDSALFWSLGTPATAIATADLTGANQNLAFVPPSSRGLFWSLAVAAAAPNPTPTPTFHALAVTKDGSGAGTVTSSPSGIDCGATCTASYASGTAVTLTATAAAGSTFTGWGGACTGTSTTCTITVDAARTATATFAAQPIAIASRKVSSKGIVTVQTEVPAAGTVSLIGTRPTGKARRAKTSRVCSATRTVAKAGTVRITCTPNKATRKVLRTKRVRVTLQITFTSAAGTTTSKTVSITLPKRGSKARPVTG